MLLHQEEVHGLNPVEALEPLPIGEMVAKEVKAERCFTSLSKDVDLLQIFECFLGPLDLGHTHPPLSPQFCREYPMNPITESRKPRNMTRRSINAALKAHGCRQRDIVEETGRSQPMVSEVVAGRRKSWPIAWAVAGRIGRMPWEIWPRLYAPPVEAAPSEAPTPEPIPHAS